MRFTSRIKQIAVQAFRRLGIPVLAGVAVCGAWQVVRAAASSAGTPPPILDEFLSNLRSQESQSRSQATELVIPSETEKVELAGHRSHRSHASHYSSSGGSGGGGGHISHQSHQSHFSSYSSDNSPAPTSPVRTPPVVAPVPVSPSTGDSDKKAAPTSYSVKMFDCYVKDGKAILILVNDVSVRLCGVSVPTNSAEAVKADLATLKGRTVLVQIEPGGSAKVPDATVYRTISVNGETSCINLGLLKKGLAAFDGTDTSTKSQAFKKAETEAKTAEVGIWARPAKPAK